MSLIKNNIKIEQNPFDLLEQWYKKAKKNEISNPNAMALSTVGSFNKPRTRMVLMKEIRENGIIFYTNSNSRKGNHINDNKNVSINFYWKSSPHDPANETMRNPALMTPLTHNPCTYHPSPDK